MTIPIRIVVLTLAVTSVVAQTPSGDSAGRVTDIGVVLFSALAASQAQAPEVRSVGTLEQRVRRVVVSPTGRHLAMTTPDNLVVMDIASGKTWSVLGRASTARSEFDELDWSPRGDLISFNRYDPSLDGQSFWVLPMDGATGHAAGGARRVTKHVGDRHAVSPDGQSIAFADYGPNGSQRIVVVAIKDGAERMLTGEREAISSVSWSDDGKWVYFSTE